jgi:hypothetical protein
MGVTGRAAVIAMAAAVSSREHVRSGQVPTLVPAVQLPLRFLACDPGYWSRGVGYLGNELGSAAAHASTMRGPNPGRSETLLPLWLLPAAAVAGGDAPQKLPTRDPVRSIVWQGSGALKTRKSDYSGAR